MGGAQPLAATMNGAACLIVEVDPARLERRLATRYLDEIAPDLDAALARMAEATAAGEAVSVGLAGNCAEVLVEIARRDQVPDVLTDQTSAHDALNGYVPAGLDIRAAAEISVA